MSPVARMGLAIASGLLLAISLPDYNFAALAWVGFVPLFVAIRGVGALRAAGIGWLAGFVWQLATIYWIPATISNFTAIPPLAAKGILLLLGAFSAYPFALLALVVEWAAARGVPRWISAPPVWVVGEWLRVVVVAGFPWNPMGTVLVQNVTLAQAADVGGVYLLSAAIVLANVSLADAWAVAARTRHVALQRIAVAVLCPALLFAYGSWRLAQLRLIPYTGSLRVGVTQGNIAQSEKWDARERGRILATYLSLTASAADAGAELVVWPEASLPFRMQDQRSVELVRIARERGVDLLVGAPGLEDRGDGRGAVPYNQAWLVRRDGRIEGPYDKIQLVPFGEYIPFFGLFGMVDVAVQSVGQLGQGTEYTIFETVELKPPGTGADPVASGADGAAHADAGTASPADAAGRPALRAARIAALICYEGIFPTLTRRFAAAGADVLVNISNDAWYGDTSAPHQHLAMAAMRSIENRLPMVRSTNTGISAFVTDEGHVGSMTSLFHEDVAVETVLVRDVWSFYRIYGDVFLHACQAFAVLLVAWAWRRPRIAVARATPP